MSQRCCSTVAATLVRQLNRLYNRFNNTFQMRKWSSPLWLIWSCNQIKWRTRFAATNECTIFIISTIYDETKVSHQSGRPIYARAKYVVILANCLHERGTPYKKKRSNQNRLLRKSNVKLHFVCKGSFKPDVCNIHSKEQSLFFAWFNKLFSWWKIRVCSH